MKARATVLCRRAGKILFVTRDRDRWSLPGGTIDAGETPHQAACRELAEEVRIDALPLHYAFQFGGLSKCHHVFVVDVPAGVRAVANREIADCRWVGARRFRALAVSIPTRRIVELVAGLKLA